MLNRKIAITNLKPVAKRRLYEHIIDQIHDLIKSGELKYGDRLPSERELAAIFKVSRNSVRDALLTLEGNQILSKKQGDGTYIIVGEETYVLEHLANAIHKEKNKLREIYQFRRLIEPQIAHLAAENITDDEIQHLEGLLRDQESNIENRQKAMEIDMAFHLALARASKNSILLTIVETINDILEQPRAKYLQSKKLRIKSYEGHLKIFKMVKEGKSTTAKSAMNEHLRTMEKISLGQENNIKKKELRIPDWAWRRKH